MEQFLSDMVYMTEGEKLLHYWWLWLILSVGAILIPAILRRRKPRKRRYFVSYQFSAEGSFGFGHLESEINLEIDNIEKIRLLAAQIEEEEDFPKGSVIILNFKLF